MYTSLKTVVSLCCELPCLAYASLRLPVERNGVFLKFSTKRPNFPIAGLMKRPRDGTSQPITSQSEFAASTKQHCLRNTRSKQQAPRYPALQLERAQDYRLVGACQKSLERQQTEHLVVQQQGNEQENSNYVGIDNSGDRAIESTFKAVCITEKKLRMLGSSSLPSFAHSSAQHAQHTTVRQVFAGPPAPVTNQQSGAGVSRSSVLSAEQLSLHHVQVSRPKNICKVVQPQNGPVVQASASSAPTSPAETEDVIELTPVATTMLHVPATKIPQQCTLLERLPAVDKSQAVHQAAGDVSDCPRLVKDTLPPDLLRCVASHEQRIPPDTPNSPGIDSCKRLPLHEMVAQHLRPGTTSHTSAHNPAVADTVSPELHSNLSQDLTPGLTQALRKAGMLDVSNTPNSEHGALRMRCTDTALPGSVSPSVSRSVSTPVTHVSESPMSSFFTGFDSSFKPCQQNRTPVLMKRTGSTVHPGEQSAGNHSAQPTITIDLTLQDEQQGLTPPSFQQTCSQTQPTPQLFRRAARADQVAGASSAGADGTTPMTHISATPLVTPATLPSRPPPDIARGAINSLDCLLRTFQTESTPLPHSPAVLTNPQCSPIQDFICSASITDALKAASSTPQLCSGPTKDDVQSGTPNGRVDDLDAAAINRRMAGIQRSKRRSSGSPSSAPPLQAPSQPPHDATRSQYETASFSLGFQGPQSPPSLSENTNNGTPVKQGKGNTNSADSKNTSSRAKASLARRGNAQSQQQSPQERGMAFTTEHVPVRTATLEPPASFQLSPKAGKTAGTVKGSQKASPASNQQPSITPASGREPERTQAAVMGEPLMSGVSGGPASLPVSAHQPQLHVAAVAAGREAVPRSSSASPGSRRARNLQLAASRTSRITTNTDAVAQGAAPTSIQGQHTAVTFSTSPVPQGVPAAPRNDSDPAQHGDVRSRVEAVPEAIIVDHADDDAFLESIPTQLLEQVTLQHQHQQQAHGERRSMTATLPETVHQAGGQAGRHNSWGGAAPSHVQHTTGSISNLQHRQLSTGNITHLQAKGVVHGQAAMNQHQSRNLGTGMRQPHNQHHVYAAPDPRISADAVASGNASHVAADLADAGEESAWPAFGHPLCGPEINMAHWAPSTYVYEIFPNQQAAIDFAAWCNRAPVAAIKQVMNIKWQKYSSFDDKWAHYKLIMDAADEELQHRLNAAGADLQAQYQDDVARHPGNGFPQKGHKWDAGMLLSAGMLHPFVEDEHGVLRWSPPTDQDHIRVFSEEVSYSNKSGYTRRFIATTYQELWRRMQRQDAAARHYYEIVSADRPSHMYFDIEFSRSANPGLDGDAVVDRVVQLVKTFMKDDFELDLDDNCFLELVSRVGLDPTPPPQAQQQQQQQQQAEAQAPSSSTATGASKPNEAGGAVVSKAGPGITIQPVQAAEEAEAKLVLPKEIKDQLSQNLSQRLSQHLSQMAATQIPQPTAQTVNKSTSENGEHKPRASGDGARTVPTVAIPQPVVAPDLPASLLNGMVLEAAKQLQQPDKFSVHLIVRLPGGFVFPSNLAVGAAIGSLRRYTEEWQALQVNKSTDPDEGVTSAVDLAVYSRTRNFRCAWNCKGGKQAVLRPSRRYMGALRATPEQQRAAAAAAAQPRPGQRRTLPQHAQHDGQGMPAILSNENIFLASLINNVAAGSPLLDCSHLDPLNRSAALPRKVPRAAARAPGGHSDRPVTEYNTEHPEAPLPLRIRWTGRDSHTPATPYEEVLQQVAIQAIPWAEAVQEERAEAGPAQVRSVSFATDTSRVSFSFIGHGSHWCGNVQRAHRSNHVYYVIDFANGSCVQKCFDPDCASYSSPPIYMPGEVWQADALKPLEPEGGFHFGHRQLNATDGQHQQAPEQQGPAQAQQS